MKRLRIKRVIIIVASMLFIGNLLGCATNKAQQGALLGALGGAAVGGQLGPEDSRRKNALIGAGIGVLLGYVVGNEWDKYDQRELNNTLEYAPTGNRTEWVNPDNGRDYAATPSRAYQRDGRIYRDVEIESVVDGQRQIVHAKAYRRTDGQWQMVQ